APAEERRAAGASEAPVHQAEPTAGADEGLARSEAGGAEPAEGADRLSTRGSSATDRGSEAGGDDAISADSQAIAGNTGHTGDSGNAARDAAEAPSDHRPGSALPRPVRPSASEGRETGTAPE